MEKEMDKHSSKAERKCMSCRHRRVIENSAGETISLCGHLSGRNYLAPVCLLDSCPGYMNY